MCSLSSGDGVKRFLFAASKGRAGGDDVRSSSRPFTSKESRNGTLSAVRSVILDARVQGFRQSQSELLVAQGTQCYGLSPFLPPPGWHSHLRRQRGGPYVSAPADHTLIYPSPGHDAGGGGDSQARGRSGPGRYSRRLL